MSVLRNIETRLADLVEGTFGRVFRTQVRPVEIARKLAREMDEHKTVSVSRTYVPNEYSVWLSPDDRARFEGVEQEVIDELAAYLLEHARRERLALVSRPQIAFRTDDRLQLGEFGIQARLVRAPATSDGSAEQGSHGHTMVYSTAARKQEELAEHLGGARPRPVLVAEGKRLAVGAGGAIIGRSRECDVVLEDRNVSRRHAEVRVQPDGSFSVHDLGSTNGVRLNGRPVPGGGEELRPGDVIELGTAEVVFELE
jgi:hypothetical protein